MTKQQKVKKRFREGHWVLTAMALPAIILMIVFHYAPMYGIIIAFKKFRFNLGIFGSEWIGFDNFTYLFQSNTIWRLLRNTLGYWAANTVLGTVIPIIFALCLERIKSKGKLKFIQTSMFLPYFLSWIIVSYFTHTLFQYDNGIINTIVTSLGGERIDFYNTTTYWPLILIFFQVWKGMGRSSLIYYGTLISVDPSLYEAATIDGCGYLKRVWYISLPHMVPSIVILFLLGLGNMLRSDTGIVFQLTKDSGSLLPVVDTLDYYIFRTLRSGGNQLGIAAAVSFMQSVVGFLLVVGGNAIARRIDKDVALY